MQPSHTSNNLSKELDRWSGANKTSSVVFSLIADDIDGKAYFLLKSKNDTYQFVLEDSGDGNYNIFEADYSGTCDNKRYCKWIKTMEEDTADAWSGDLINNEEEQQEGLFAVLTTAVRNYKAVHKLSESALGSVRLKKGLQSDLALKLLELYTNENIKARIISNNTWELKITTDRNEDIKALAVINKLNSGATYAKVRILYPRLELGGNVNFGGVVRAYGTTPHTPIVIDRSTPEGKNTNVNRELLKAIYSALKDERKDPRHSEKYTQGEYECASQDILPMGFVNGKYNKNVPFKIFDRRDIKIFGTSDLIKGDVVILNNYFGKYASQESERLYVCLTTTFGSSCWASVSYYSKMPINEVRISETTKESLGLNNGDKLTLTFGDLPIPDKLIMRARSEDVLDDELLDAVESMTCLTVGNTYAFKNRHGYIRTFDVFYAGKSGACRTFGERGEQRTTQEIRFEVAKYLKEKDPLDISESDSSNEESSDETSEESD